MQEKIEGFLDNLAEFGNDKLSLLIREYSTQKNEKVG